MMLALLVGCGPSRLPDLVLITLDTTRADHLGSYGYERARTPRLDAFAGGGVRFTRASTVTNNTLPSHVSMLTGQYPQTHGVPRNGHKLPAEVRTLAQELHDAGYETGAVVSASALSGKLGLDRGFDHYDDSFDVKELDQRQRLGVDTTARALAWLKEPRDKPVFLWVHYFDPHYPYTPIAPYDTWYGKSYRGPADGSLEYLLGVWGRGVPKVQTTAADRARMVDLYDGELMALDAALTPLFEYLGRATVRSHTAVVLTADHGESLTEHDYLFDHGEYLYQPSLHVPLVVRLPGDEPPTGTVDALVQGLDVFPTLLTVAGLPIPERTEGHDLVPLVRGEVASVRDVALAESCRPWSVEEGHEGDYANLYKAQAAVRWPYKLVVTPFLGKVELYDLDGDPEELHDIASQHADVVAELTKDLQAWRKTPFRMSAPDAENMEAIEALGYTGD